MGSYHVEHAPEHRFPRLHLSAATVLLAALIAVGIPSFARVDVTVDGTPHALPSGAVVSDLVERGWTSRPGDLMSIEGTVVVQGGGQVPTIMRGGVTLDRGTRLADGDRLTSRPGTDVVESSVTTRVPIPIEVAFEGEGALMALVSLGSVGIEERVVGEYSGIVSTSTVVLAAQPMVVRRFVPRKGDKVVALTFDDGPWPTYTAQVLDVLKSENVKATFFMIGRQVYRYPALVRRVRDEGHTIGNHTQSHAYLSRATPEQVRAQIYEGQAAIQKVAGVKSRWFRPPGGMMAPAVGPESSRLGLRVAMWTVDPQDWRKPPAPTIVRKVVLSARPGTVVLMHDGGGDRSATVESLRSIIRELKKQGYTFVTLDELAP